MTLEPIHIDEDPTLARYANSDCQALFEAYPTYYHETGYTPPWIGYFVIRDEVVVGMGGFVGAPQNGRVEIAYGTFKAYEGQGIASFACQQLVTIAKATDPTLIVTAKTAPEQNASNTILSRHGFVYTGVVQDHEIGDAWEWVYQG
ncbi:GNAT family N-acetyltransferase [Fibrella aquatilis]|uniref:GNAT family N-acetyltransferase n=1 Tax=Fibrella aquatilis TaxID=2817059 RepID=A0A939GB41_9BACT|nr:GNAT family N-acetyltransferase [Fibrella aquatilis]MBO0934295.1 GNAT family N-acetyltransferase [Fibrella aquatilis]